MLALLVFKTERESLVGTFVYLTNVSPTAKCAKGKGSMQVPVLSCSHATKKITYAYMETALPLKWQPQSPYASKLFTSWFSLIDALSQWVIMFLASGLITFSLLHYMAFQINSVYVRSKRSVAN